MRTIIHISDVHFGKIEDSSINSLLVVFSVINPDLVIISGDLTQRAKVKQYKSAKIFLDNLKKAGIGYFVVPGNHDIEPLWKPIRRIFNPYKNYQKYISETIEPVYADSEIAIAGLNTARPAKLKNGSINQAQIKKIQEWFSTFSPEILKIVVTHHPLDLPIHLSKRRLARRALRGIESFSANNIDLYLSGHYHQSSVITTAERYNKLGYYSIALQAGTLSTRQRGEVQSFNVISYDKPKLSVETYLWDSADKKFLKKSITDFSLTDNLWRKL
jgi:3',5'-cyclic AMP phosphodiesterase CpdA